MPSGVMRGLKTAATTAALPITIPTRLAAKGVAKIARKVSTRKNSQVRNKNDIRNFSCKVKCSKEQGGEAEEAPTAVSPPEPGDEEHIATTDLFHPSPSRAATTRLAQPTAQPVVSPSGDEEGPGDEDEEPAPPPPDAAGAAAPIPRPPTHSQAFAAAQERGAPRRSRIASPATQPASALSAATDDDDDPDNNLGAANEGITDALPLSPDSPAAEAPRGGGSNSKRKKGGKKSKKLKKSKKYKRKTNKKQVKKKIKVSKKRIRRI